jgi:hypothetical protein
MNGLHKPKQPGILLTVHPVIHRCWKVEPCPGGWMGRTVGISEPHDATTEVGELRLVLKALTWPNGPRRGLPIVVTSEPHAREVAA